MKEVRGSRGQYYLLYNNYLSIQHLKMSVQQFTFLNCAGSFDICRVIKKQNYASVFISLTIYFSAYRL